MVNILINSYNKNSGDYQNFNIQLNTPLAITKPSKLKLKYFTMVNGVYNVNGYDIIEVYEVETDNSTGGEQTKLYAVSIPEGSYTASDFASAAQTAITNASSVNGFGWNYTVTYDSTTTQLTYNMTTANAAGYTYRAAVSAISGNYSSYAQYITGLPAFNFGNSGYLPITVIPHLNSYNLLITINKNTHDTVTTSIKKFSFIVPFSTSNNNITYMSEGYFENIITVFLQSFNNLEISLACLEFDPIINNDCVMLLELSE